ncbi:unnamed protein product [Meloidogyne enterolobii]|uniref:Uncharacterized protein n=1 Tax=Meloidogyne enterolobii TaxID=390850 RepID=A0ACB0ZZW9_MELEN
MFPFWKRLLRENILFWRTLIGQKKKEWKLRRRIDGRREIVYTFPRDFVLRPGKTVKIWANGHGIHSPPDQLVYEGEDNFGVGYNVQTILYNRENEERASLIQRSSGRQ